MNGKSVSKVYSGENSAPSFADERKMQKIFTK